MPCPMCEQCHAYAYAYAYASEERAPDGWWLMYMHIYMDTCTYTWST